MEKEGISQEQILSAQMKQDASHSRTRGTDGNFYYLGRFEENDRLYNLYTQGLLSFKDYVFAPVDRQSHMLLFTEQCENADEVLRQGYIDFNKHLDHLYWSLDDLFNPNFCKYMLAPKRVSLDEYIKKNELPVFYALSKFFKIADFELLLKEQTWSFERLALLSVQDIRDLTRLLALGEWEPSVWLDAKYLTIEQFIECNSNDRRKYMSCMFYQRTPCNNFTLEHFLSFKESTRRYFRFDQSYIIIEEFDTLASNIQKSLRDSLFSNIGRYALSCNYVTVKQYCNLSQTARNILQVNLFEETEEIYWQRLRIQKLTDKLFLNGFNLEKFNILSEQSIEKAKEYMNHISAIGNEIRNILPSI